MANQYYDDNLRYIQEEYGRQPTFSSFLPGIAGPFGIPAWCNYNNRGQAVCSFGVENKDHAILEFTAAATAYRQTPLTGFRTFLKTEGEVVEPFFDGLGTLAVEANALTLFWSSRTFHVEVLYFTLPNERMAGLCRKVTVSNVSQQARYLELLDGLATIVPYGVQDAKLKQEANLSTAWMHVDGTTDGIPCFRVRASMEDTAEVTDVVGANFRIALDKTNGYLPAIVQPSQVFGWDTTLLKPVGFQKYTLKELLKRPQQADNYLPCCFTAWEGDLAAGDVVTLWEFYGQAESPQDIMDFRAKADTITYFENKHREAQVLAEGIIKMTACRTGNRLFDGYVGQNFLDNVLRGGLPYSLAGTQVYLYSRKHGDPEREYNYFSLRREYLSQGNANFRDVCQNRRSDTFLLSGAGRFNLQLFTELIQPDGYNPLVIEPVSYITRNGKKLAELVPAPYRDYAYQTFSAPFSLGKIAFLAETWNVSSLNTFLSAVLAECTVEPNATFDTGYWSDHWTYLLDLVENEVALYPDQEREILFGPSRYRWYSGWASVLPQAERYCITERGLRQYNCTKPEIPSHKWVQNQSGGEARSSLAEKLLFLCAVKYSTLDFSGVAVEMEGGKPGWYDALNGLPGLLGASVAEGCELLRLLQYLLARGGLFPEQITLYQEIIELFLRLSNLDATQITPLEKWIARNQIRDKYRTETRFGFSGKRNYVQKRWLFDILHSMEGCLQKALDSEIQANGGICPTYFYYDVLKFDSVPGGFLPRQVNKVTMPLFLEGSTRFFRTKQPVYVKRRMVEAIKNSPLFDRELQMYRLNDSLQNVSYEVGRARAFPTGWLENGSIWLHMEYKYLLSLLDSGLYQEFFEAFATVVIPFLPPKQYGRSTLENSSFLVPSTYEDKGSHGRGYVARLTGSTAEFISIWNRMIFGKAPFQVGLDGLSLQFRPVIPKILFPADGLLMGTFLGCVAVFYHTNGFAELCPGAYMIKRYHVSFENTSIDINGNVIPEPWAIKIRNRIAKRIDVYFTLQNERNIYEN